MRVAAAPSLASVVARAADFATATARPIESALAAALAVREAADGLVARLVAAQREDGAFAFTDFLGDPLAGTLFALSALDALAELSKTPAAKAAAWLRTVQRDDGAFAPAGGGAPRVFTGLLAGFLAKSPHAHTQMIEGAAECLARQWSPDVVRSGDLGAIAAYAHTFSNLPHEASDEILQWCGRELERALRGGRVQPAQGLRVFALCDSVALPGAPSDARALWPRLLEGQDLDGGWGGRRASASNGARAAATLDALFALRHFGGRAAFAPTA